MKSADLPIVEDFPVGLKPDHLSVKGVFGAWIRRCICQTFVRTATLAEPEQHQGKHEKPGDLRSAGLSRNRLLLEQGATFQDDEFKNPNTVVFKIQPRCRGIATLLYKDLSSPINQVTTPKT